MNIMSPSASSLFSPEYEPSNRYADTLLSMRDEVPDHIRKDSPYGYVPTGWVCYLFVILFGLSTVIHVFQALRSRTYWLLYTAVLCGVGETIGWGARLWSHYAIHNSNAYLIQICTTIIAPTPLLAVNFVLLGKIVSLIGQEYSLLTAKYFSILFVSADIVALVVQGVGGGFASTAKDPTQGGVSDYTSFSGIAVQFGFMVLYCILSTDFFWRSRNHKVYTQHYKVVKEVELRRTTSPDSDSYSSTGGALNDPKLRMLIYGLAFNTLCLFIRAIYRLIELSDGFTGIIMLTERWFVLFDAAMVVLALGTINVVHPGWFLPSAKPISTQSRV